MSQFKKISLALVLCLLFGCEKSSTSELSASATSEKTSDGTIVSRDATEAELAGLDRIDAIMAKINKQFPGAATPFNAARVKATQVSAPGVIELTDGRQFQIDGVSCNGEGLASVSEYAIGDNTTVVVIPTGPATDLPARADIWAVDSSLFDGEPIHSFTALGETALMSGWCTLSITAHSKYASRYSALFKEFATARQ